MLGLPGSRERASCAQKHQALYERFKADEAAQFITGPYRQLHPHDNNERQSIHEHRSYEPAPAAPAPRRRRATRVRASAQARQARARNRSAVGGRR